MLEKIKKLINNYYVRQVVITMGMIFSFLIIDLYLRYFSNQHIGVYRFTHASPFLFTLSWISIFITIFNLFNKKLKIIIYEITLIIFNVLMVAQTIYMKIFTNFFGLSDFFMAGEGSDYFKYAITLMDMKTILIVILSIISSIVTILIIHFTEYKKKNIYDYLIVILLGILLTGSLRYLAINRLGKMKDPTSWEASYNVRNIYEDFNNQGKNVEIAGLYEQTFRNSYLYIIEQLTSDKKEISEMVFEELKDIENISSQNEYTGIFKDKNMILILLETIDSFLVNDEVMPTLTTMKNEGWNFTNRYAPAFGGGQTINSEFAVNTGLYAIDNSKAIYNYNNKYPYSLPNLLKDNGYSVNSVHENTGKFYNRTIFHKNMGYENHYSISDMNGVKQSDFILDTTIIKNDEFDKYIFNDDKFMTFMITYSAHMPYNLKENPNCNVSYGLEVENNKELSCFRNLARDTDEFLKLLIEKLDKKGILDDTVLVLFTDHYAYAYEDSKYIKDIKGTDNINLIQNVPFIIWSNDIKHQEINTLMDTADIAPTLLNLWGINYDSKNYIGQDIFNSDRDNFVYFGANTFYDGKMYYDGKNKLEEKEKKYVSNILNKINKTMNLNKNIILSDYFITNKKQ